MTERLVKNLLQQSRCHICNSNYVNIRIGQKHIYGICPKCERCDEIGLVY